MGKSERGTDYLDKAIRLAQSKVDHTGNLRTQLILWDMEDLRTVSAWTGQIFRSSKDVKVGLRRMVDLRDENRLVQSIVGMMKTDTK